MNMLTLKCGRLGHGDRSSTGFGGIILSPVFPVSVQRSAGISVITVLRLNVSAL